MPQPRFRLVRVTISIRTYAPRSVPWMGFHFSHFLLITVTNQHHPIHPTTTEVVTMSPTLVLLLSSFDAPHLWAPADHRTVIHHTSPIVWSAS